MNGFIYFLPDAPPKITDKVAEAYGVRRLLRGTAPAMVTGTGPGGAAGVFLALAGVPAEQMSLDCSPPEMKFDEDSGNWTAGEQLWREDGRHWTGMLTTAKPGPADLERPLTDSVPGHRVRMVDGNEWLVPVARSLDGSSNLPEIVTLAADGQLRYKAREEFGPLAAAAGRIFGAYRDAVMAMQDQDPARRQKAMEATRFPFQWLWTVAVEALSINYRVDGVELSLLEVLDTQTLATIADTIIDMPARQEAAENPTPLPAGDSTSAGGREPLPVTCPPGQTSGG